MKFILSFLLLHCLQTCEIYYNSDIRFDMTDTVADNIKIDEKKSLYFNICGTLKYQCQKQENETKMIQNEQSLQNIIIVEDNECDFYARQHDLNSNDLSLINENKPFDGFILNIQGIDDDETMKLHLICSSSQEFQIQTPCEYDVCLSHQSACPILVYNPMMAFYRFLYIPFGILLMLIGIVLIIFGFRYIRVTTILMAFIFGFVLYTIVMSESVLDEQSSNFALIMIICSGVGVGVIYANSVQVRQLLSYFNVGLVFASILSLMIQSSLLHLLTPKPMFLGLSLTFVILGLIFGILAMKFVNGLGIGGTALVGSYLIIRQLASFIGGYPNEIYLVKQQFYGFNKNIDFRFYLYLSSIFILTIGSIFFQYRQLKQRMSLDEMMQYQDLNYYELGNFKQEKTKEVQGFEVESVIIKEQFVKKLDNEIRKSNSSKSSD